MKRLLVLLFFMFPVFLNATRAGLINKGDVPKSISGVLGTSLKEKLTNMIADVVISTFEKMKNDFDGVPKRIYMSPEIINAVDDLRSFLFDNVYERDSVSSDFNKIFDLISSLYNFFVKNPDKLLKQIEVHELYDDINKVACDYISGMTDHYALNCYRSIFLPRGWSSDEIVHLK